MLRVLIPGLRPDGDRPGTSRGMAVAALLAAVALTAAGCSSDGAVKVGGSASASPTGEASAAADTAAADDASPSPQTTISGTPNFAKALANGFEPPVVADTNEVAQAKGASVAVFDSVKDTKASKTLKNPLPSGAPLTFLVLEHQGQFLRVLLPVRPNQSQGWIKASDVTVRSVAYRLTVSVGKHTLTVYQAGKQVLSTPVGLGTSTTPTPGGVYYLKELIKPTDPNGAYGPFAYGLSGYSNVLNEFAGGDGEIGIHGTNDPTGIGKSVSHGCIRVSNDVITKLSTMLPLGTPVQITR